MDNQTGSRAPAPVQQITTGTVGHLDAEMVGAAVAGWNIAGLDYLFIENVGDLVCPASYDVGETIRAVLLPVTAGEDTPLKYPTIFNSSDLAVVTKMDLADAVGFRRDDARTNIRAVAPGLAICEVSSRSGQGMADWLRYLHAVSGAPFDTSVAAF